MGEFFELHISPMMNTPNHPNNSPQNILQLCLEEFIKDQGKFSSNQWWFIGRLSYNMKFYHEQKFDKLRVQREVILKIYSNPKVLALKEEIT